MFNYEILQRDVLAIEPMYVVGATIHIWDNTIGKSFQFMRQFEFDITDKTAEQIEAEVTTVVNAYGQTKTDETQTLHTALGFYG